MSVTRTQWHLKYFSILAASSMNRLKIHRIEFAGSFLRAPYTLFAFYNNRITHERDGSKHFSFENRELAAFVDR